MNRLAALLLACVLTHGAWAETTLRVPDDHATIQAAIAAAPEGAVIVIAEGTYNEQFTISRPVTLVGEGEVIVRSIDRQRPVISLVDAVDTTLRGITVESISPRPTGNPERRTEATVVIIGGAPVLEDCVIRNGAHSGLKVGGHAQPEFVNCTFEGHGQSGVFVFGSNARPLFTGCRFQNNRYNGITFHGGSRGTVEDCDIESNQRNGIMVIGQGTAPTIRHSRARANVYNGIVLMEHAGGVLEENEFNGNGASGINLQEVAADLVVRLNHAEYNAFSGFHLAQPTAALIEKNRFVRNGVISSGEISLLASVEDFEALDLLEERLRVDEVRFPSGAWQLSFFYNYLLEAWRGLPQRHSMSFVEWCGRWQYARPDSPAARIVRGKWHAQEAWRVRGAGEPDTVSEADWETFAEELAMAYAALNEALAVTGAHPQAYADLVHVLGSAETMPADLAGVREAAWADAAPSAPSARAMFDEGAAAAPAYFPLYTGYARFLMPRLGGERGAVEAFAAEQSDARAELLGDSLYAIVANDVLHSFYLWSHVDAYLEDFSFDWPRVERGHRDLIAHTPLSSFWPQSLALHACLHRDREIAAEIFARMDEADTRWDADIWHSEHRFYTYYAWAVEEGPYPEVSLELLLAIQMGDTAAAETLLEEGAEVNTVGQLGYAPLTFAVDRRDAAMTALLLEHGADPDFQLYSGLAPLHQAAGRNDLAILELLLEHGADIDALSDDGSNALMYAAYAGRTEAIERLVTRGAEIDLRHPSGSTAFIVAVRQGQLEAARALLAAGAEPSVTTLEGESALDIAQAHGHEAVAAWLTETAVRSGTVD